MHKNKTIKFDMAGEGQATKVLFFEASQTKRCELFAFPTAISVSSMYGPSHGRGTLNDSGPGLRRRGVVCESAHLCEFTEKNSVTLPRVLSVSKFSPNQHK